MNSKLKIIVISDTHCKYHQTLPAGDILIHCGDFTSGGSDKEILHFIDWLKAQPFKHKVVIAGNHDILLDIEYYKRLHPRFPKQDQDQYEKNSVEMTNKMKQVCHYLVNEEITLEGYRIWGSPFSLEFCDWAFEIKNENAFKFWEQIPDGIDILLTHGPPKGFGDLVVSKARVGDQALLERVLKVKPKYHLFGHIHEDYGKWEHEGVVFMNCSSCNFNYKITGAPVVIELDRKE